MEIDYSNHEQLVSLMDHADEYPTMLMGENQDGEFTMTSILHDRVIVEVLQDNDWTRKSIIHRDGTIEQTFERGTAE